MPPAPPVAPMPPAPPVLPMPPAPPLLLLLLEASPEELLDVLELLELPVRPLPPEDEPSSVPVAHAPIKRRSVKEGRRECMKPFVRVCFRVRQERV